jgi:rare lipoprotein A
MIISRILSGLRGSGRWFRHIVSGLLMLFGALGHAKAGPAVDQTATSGPTEAAAAETPKDNAETGEALVEERGIASWYGRAWRGRRTASGAPFDDRALTAAHLWLPFATRARVTNLQNGRSVDVVVNDRGPYHEGRIIDLSARAAEALGIKECGIAEVIVIAQL